MATAQINARIDAGIKSAGDRALSQAGYSPTQAVRLLWGFAAEHWHDIGVIRALFDTLKGAGTACGDEGEAELRARRAEEGPCIFEAACADMGISTQALESAAGISDEELLERAFRDKLEERGLAQ